jgi:hypothetical protein
MPYRRFAIGKRTKARNRWKLAAPADRKSAIQRIENLRYAGS